MILDEASAKDTWRPICVRAVISIVPLRDKAGHLGMALEKEGSDPPIHHR
jgi:hypothetical protein